MFDGSLLALVMFGLFADPGRNIPASAIIHPRILKAVHSPHSFILDDPALDFKLNIEMIMKTSLCNYIIQLNVFNFFRKAVSYMHLIWRRVPVHHSLNQ